MLMFNHNMEYAHQFDPRKYVHSDNLKSMNNFNELFS